MLEAGIDLKDDGVYDKDEVSFTLWAGDGFHQCYISRMN